MTTAPRPPAGPAPVPSAAVIVPGPGRTFTFVLRRRGVHAGHWLLPRGGIEPGESAERAARRAAQEAAGLRTGALAPTGIYDVRGTDDGAAYRFRVHVYRALRRCPLPADRADAPAEVAGIDQAHPRDILPHPSDMLALNDAGLADYAPALVQRLLEADGVTVDRLDA
ncbi:NUDIX domain-containing protein [Nocardiopsis trehalosi]|uniref:NUDIX domain-containing protein n=1 Tax=Nocardiopsis trehalosi TaxID=109329 RepID=UPI000836C999|nr:NUDIX domain-containing protein [Nocardiopsis trehalosi]